MSCVTFRRTRLQALHADVSRAFAHIPEVYRVRVVDASADGELVRERLEVMGLGFDASRAGSAVHATCDRVTVVCLSKEMSDRACEIAQYVACICRLWRYTKPVKIIVAARRASKVVSFRRPLVMDDINSGVTYHKDGTIIMFRSDPDFWKVLCHECIHLCRGEDDEAKTEFEALLVHTMVVSSDWGDFTRRFDEQKRRSRANSDVLRHVHPGDTNAARYWQVGCEMLHNAEDVLGGRWRKVALRPGTMDTPDVPDMAWVVSSFGHTSGVLCRSVGVCHEYAA